MTNYKTKLIELLGEKVHLGVIIRYCENKVYHITIDLPWSEHLLLYRTKNDLIELVNFIAIPTTNPSTWTEQTYKEVYNSLISLSETDDSTKQNDTDIKS
jgi:hypothetical protein